jgi:hypothetical protein
MKFSTKNPRHRKAAIRYICLNPKPSPHPLLYFFVAFRSNANRMKYFLIVSLLCMSLRVSGFGLGDAWGQETPGGNLMGEHYSGNGIYLTIPKTGEELFGVERWYFYDNFIVGELEDALFIIDERTGEKLIFKDRSKWIKEIQSRKLEPVLWTRWHTGDWVISPILLFLLLYWFVMLMLLILPFALFFMFILVNERFRLPRFFKIFAFSIVTLIGIILLLYYYPFALFFIFILISERFRLSRFFKIFALSVVTLIGIILLLDYYPSSI